MAMLSSLGLYVYKPPSELVAFLQLVSPLPIVLPPYQAVPTHLTTLYHYRYQHGQTSHLSSRRHSGYGLGIGFLERLSTVKVLLVNVSTAH